MLVKLHCPTPTWFSPRRRMVRSREIEGFFPYPDNQKVEATPHR